MHASGGESENSRPLWLVRLLQARAGAYVL